MILKTFTPSSPGRRQLTQINRDILWKGKPIKILTKGLCRSGGRNNKGRLTANNKGGGHKRSYRIIDFKRKKWNIIAKVKRLEYDPNRTSFIALLSYEGNTLSYILAPQKLIAGDYVISGKSVDIKPGNAMLLKSIPVGTILHNIEMKPGKGGQIARAAGSFAQLVARDQNYVTIKLSSGEQRLILSSCMGTIGSVSNADHININLGKAGRSRWLGRTPHTRGVAMNPIDHPHGGGEARTSGGRHPVTPWGKSTKGKRTRKNKKTDKYIIRSRHICKK